MVSVPTTAVSVSKRSRLSKSADFDRVYRKGRSYAGRYLVLYNFPRIDSSEGDRSARLGVSVSRKLGSAVERNRVKRLIKEALAATEVEGVGSADLVVVVRPKGKEFFKQAKLADLQGELDELLQRAFKPKDR